MDTNNATGGVGAGEREGRIYSRTVSERHFGLSHGIGRSGELTEVQPKACGSALIHTLTHTLTRHALCVCGLTRVEAALVVPCATGMTLALVLMALRRQRPASARFVVWSRIDQKSAFKSILAAGCEPIIVPLRLVGDELQTDLHAMEAAVAAAGGPDAVVAVMTTTSCFAPRAPDGVKEVAVLCTRLGVPHVINNAYGLQASKICHEINEACRLGRVDAIVQSCDKNFMVPVGGAIVASPQDGSTSCVKAVAQLYPGRASMSPVLDLFITLLEMGVTGLKELLVQRKDVAAYLRERLAKFAAAHGERLLESPHNPISFAISVDNITGRRAGSAAAVPADASTASAAPHAPAAEGAGIAEAGAARSTTASADAEAAPTPAPAARADTRASPASTASPTHAARSASMLGSMLFARGITGTRVIVPDEVRSVDGYKFVGFGAQYDAYPTAYMTAAAAIGMTREDVDVFMERLERTVAAYKKENASDRRRGSSRGKASSSHSQSPPPPSGSERRERGVSLDEIAEHLVDIAESRAAGELLESE